MPQKTCCGLKTCNTLNIEQLGICTVKLQHKNNAAKCKFSVVPGDAPVLFEKLDIEVMEILKITCEVINSQQTGRKFNPQITQTTGVLKCKTHRMEVHKK